MVTVNTLCLRQSRFISLIMLRKTAWRTASSDVLNWNQDQAANTTMLILKEFGPTGFLLKEEGDSKAFKLGLMSQQTCGYSFAENANVFLGDPHSCTCSSFLKEKDLCKHICWVLIKKFRLPRDHEYSLQLGLLDRQITELLQGQHRLKTLRGGPVTTETPQDNLGPGDGHVTQKEVGDDDVCPICQDELKRRRLPVTYCRFGCGNNVHISCMKVWADHQPGLEAVNMLKCPLCREGFGLVEMLQEQVKNAAKLLTLAERERPDKHLGVPCNNCLTCPITGKCFKCITCRYFHLCEDCSKKNCHPQHPLAFRMKRTHEWQLQTHSAGHAVGSMQEPGSPPSDGQASICAGLCDPIPGEVLKSLPSVKVKVGCPLLEPGQQCRICLTSFQLGQVVRNLPCRHKFHSDCTGMWVQRTNACPLDGHIVYNPLTWGRSKAKAVTKLGSPTPIHPIQPELFVPGIGLQVWARRCTQAHDQSDNNKVEGPSRVTPTSIVLHTLEAFHISRMPTGSPEHGTQNKALPETGSDTGQGIKSHAVRPRVRWSSKTVNTQSGKSVMPPTVGLRAPTKSYHSEMSFTLEGTVCREQGNQIQGSSNTDIVKTDPPHPFKNDRNPVQHHTAREDQEGCSFYTFN